MVSDNIRTTIFFGFAGLWILWGIVYYILDYGIRVYLSSLIMIFSGLIILIIIRNANLIVSPGWVRIINVKIP